MAAIIMPTLYVAVGYRRKFLAGLLRQRMQFYFYFGKHPGAERGRLDCISGIVRGTIHFLRFLLFLVCLYFKVVLPQATIGLGRLPDNIGEAANVSMLRTTSEGV